jgi:C-terminal processing protease CtpA/Prc
LSTAQRRGFGAGLLAGVVVGLAIAAVVAWVDNPFAEDEDAVSEAREVIEESYFRVPNEQALERASIDGMIRELRQRYGDRFSHYFDPKALAEFESATSGNFSGVGLTLASPR